MLYPFDLMAKRDWRLMTLAERGLLFSMWCECWANKELPAAPHELAAMVGKSVEEVQLGLSKRVLSFFEESETGILVSPDIETYRKNVLDQRERMSKGGRKGGNTRAENERKAREASRHPSASNQAPLKGRETESESESENQSLGGDEWPLNVEWINEYEKASRGC